LKERSLTPCDRTTQSNAGPVSGADPPPDRGRFSYINTIGLDMPGLAFGAVFLAILSLGNSNGLRVRPTGPSSSPITVASFTFIFFRRH
jgi:hypothetical protein